MFTLNDLEQIIEKRSAEPVDTSYTASLLKKGREKCAEKFGEEAVEAIIAAASDNRDNLVLETADVFYHLLVLLKSSEIQLEEVMSELQRRTAQSGHQEKASRNNSQE